MVLVDRSMPVMDGLEATRKIQELFPDVPIIGLTADALPHEVASFVAAGAWFVLIKPVSKAVLKDTLDRFIGNEGVLTEGVSSRASSKTPRSTDMHMEISKTVMFNPVTATAPVAVVAIAMTTQAIAVTVE